jgi:beta-glucosidase
MGGVMCAMTKVNGTLSCENAPLQQKLLKTKLGFPGLLADVSGQPTELGSANGGLDFGSSSIWSNTTLLAGINNGSLTQARLDDMAVRNVIGYYYVNLDNGIQPTFVSSSAHVDVRGNHSRIVRENGAASLVVLKNTKGALPLNKPLSMALFGSHAGPVMAGPNYVFSVQGAPSTYEGHLAGGSGSGQTSFPYLITPQQALTNRASSDGTMIRWILNNTYTSTTDTGGFGGMRKRQAIALLSGGTALTQTISSYASGAEVCLAFINALFRRRRRSNGAERHRARCHGHQRSLKL